MPFFLSSWKQFLNVLQCTVNSSNYGRTYVFKDFILFPVNIQYWIICQSSEKNVPYQKQYFPFKNARQWTQIDHYATHSLVSYEISELNDMTKIDTKNKDIGNYMTVMKCIWGNLDLSNQIIDEKKCEMCLPTRNAWQRMRKIGHNNRIDKHTIAFGGNTIHVMTDLYIV